MTSGSLLSTCAPSHQSAGMQLAPGISARGPIALLLTTSLPFGALRAATRSREASARAHLVTPAPPFTSLTPGPDSAPSSSAGQRGRPHPASPASPAPPCARSRPALLHRCHRPPRRPQLRQPLQPAGHACRLHRPPRPTRHPRPPARNGNGFSPIRLALTGARLHGMRALSRRFAPFRAFVVQTSRR